MNNVVEPVLSQPAKVGLDVCGVHKSYGKSSVLNGVDLKVEPGEFLTLLGPSGSGKTTLLMTIAGFVRPGSGRILLGAEDITRKPPHKRDIGMMFQNYALFPHMTVAENIAYPLKLRGMPAAERKDRVSGALHLVQLAGYESRAIGELSGGQKQRVALARATVFRPRLLLMDEPLSALDKKLREQMQVELRKLHRQLGMTTICVTHDQHEALTMSDRIAVMNAGNIAQLGSPDELYENPASVFVADFIGESVILPVHVNETRAMLRGQVLNLPPGCVATSDSLLVIRPERLRLLPGDAEPETDMNIFTGVISHQVYEGESVVVHVDIGDSTPLRARVLSQHTRTRSLLPGVGSTVRLGLHADDTILVKG